MFKQLVNECLIDLHLIPEGPILIKSGLATISGPDMAFVTVFRNGREEVYLPGSSLKGVLRSHAERITRTLNPEAACDPFAAGQDDKELSCGICFDKRKKEKENLDTPTVYKDSCLICKLFGSTWLAGRLATSDAYAVEELPRPQRRDGVGIDRFTGGAAGGAKFELEVVVEGVFATTLYLRNFELWQLALIGFLLQDLKDGLIRIGMGKSRGLGKIRSEVKNMQLSFLGTKAPKVSDGMLPLLGIGSLFNDAGMYKMVSPDEVSVPFDGELISNGLRTKAIFPDDSFPWTKIAGHWVNYSKSYQISETMKLVARSGKYGS